MPIDYSKWKKIEVSDDEDDTHPNIDTPSLYRWRHQARLERMAEKKQEKEKIEKDKCTTSSKMKDLEDKLSKADISDKDREEIQKEIDDVKAQEEKWRAKEKELEEKERLEPWNVDTIGHEAFSTSRINKITEKPKATISDEEDSKKMAQFCEENESLLQTYGRLVGLKATEAYLAEHPHLACEYSANYLTIECLNLAIDRREEEMCLLSEQCIVMQYLLELSKNLRADPTNTNMQKSFFKKFAAADPSYMKTFQEEVTAFQDRLRTRANEKREAAAAEYEAEERQKRIEQAPGGLDPQEVFETLPEEMRNCFESQNIQALKDLALKMDEEVFMYHFQRCVDSGLWVPEKKSENEIEEDDDSEIIDVEGTETDSVATEDLVD
ncbi:unnamed protein product [Caenorhabditis angaria]|uniref:Hsp90 chaperone protein kinase-targeting subunit n=1 Tax=Caenorhabditis angaria TaxID=860376 RepID=A0A9P1ICF6_9PELO|nr:unnamed protein product [Caenorhabditis angaria]